VQASVGYVLGATVQITSADPNIINADIRIDRVELDGSRLANSVPSYPGYPGRNAVALAINRTDAVEIGSLRLRNYESYPVQLADNWRAVNIGTLEFANSDSVEKTYKAIVLQYRTAGDGVLSIRRIEGRLAGPDHFALRSDVGHLKVNVEAAAVTGGLFGAYLTGYIGQAADGREGRARLCSVGCRDVRFGLYPP
jgi:hypothetical protein